MTEPTVQSYPVLPLKNVVVFPDVVHHLAVGRPKSLAALVAAEPVAAGARSDTSRSIIALNADALRF